MLAASMHKRAELYAIHTYECVCMYVIHVNMHAHTYVNILLQHTHIYIPCICIHTCAKYILAVSALAYMHTSTFEHGIYIMHTFQYSHFDATTSVIV